MSSRLVARFGQIAIAAVVAVGVGSQALPAEAALSTLTVNGIILDPFPTDPDPSDSFFTWSAYAGYPTSTGLELANIGVGDATTAPGNIANFTTSGAPFGTTGHWFALNFKFDLLDPAELDALNFQDNIDYSNISNLHIKLLNSVGAVVGGGGVTYNDGTFMTLDYANLPAGDYTLRVVGRVPTDGVGNVIGLAVVSPSTVPVPAAVLMFGSGLLGVFGVARFKRAKATPDAGSV